MAILPSIPGLTVTIDVADKVAKEYNDPDVDSMQTDMQPEEFDLPVPHTHTARGNIPYIVKYIEAKPKALFAFHVTLSKRFPHRSHHVAYKVVTDGTKTSTKHITEKCRVERGGLSVLESYFSAKSARTPGGNHIIRRFCFAALDVVESDHFSAEEVKKQMARAKECGVLKVLLYHMEDSNGQYRPNGTSVYPESSAEARTAMAEKVFKGRAVDCVTSVVSEPSKGPTRHLVDIYHDRKRRPFAIFEFRYRSKDGLIKEGIISPPTVSDEVEEMSEGEVRRKLSELLEQNQRQSQQGQDVKPSRGVKREADRMEIDDWAPDPAFERRYRTRRLSHGRMEIDLTDD
ncbi:hypothetical protein QBC40DRAFT_275628 [Triangularia verruculosa]|uniref:DUF7918 domain-containing protein n=1 Tax=Triangularia verruculosa TaxID=2587418 RepID=A0AAN7AVQ3_9PEZI|nr:hypothetical protein QBC40DRAFT_275628 [Triangularia verruculosa]